MLFRKYHASLILSLAGILCLIAYKAIGAFVQPNGLLVEPFVLLPTFWLFQLTAVLTWLVTFVRHRKTQ